ncbi:hypothetical protein BZZ01_32465 [Nostocales cyanobacterium HT-58-2]|nr:hypothetical protein BZZ01_32465 [Nostocales cyanobacterium HT-58-2]
MTSTPQFNDVELFQQFCLRYVNKRVREYFHDIDDVSIDGLDIDNARQVARAVCLHKDNDPITLTTSRLIAFFIVLGDALDKNPVYSIPTITFQQERKFKPQIQLCFIEDPDDVEPGYSPVAGEISFRLAHESTTTLTNAELVNYGQKVKTNFGSRGGFVWRKGKTMCSYSDWDRGYQLQLLCRDKSEGKRVIEQVLDIQGHTPDWKKMNVSENEEPAAAYPTVPAQETILGKSRRMARKRPIASVKFQYAIVHIHGVRNPIVLYDRTKTKRNPLVI